MIILLLQTAALLKLQMLATLALPIATFWSRVSPILAIENFPYLKNEGNGSFHRKNKQGLHEFKPSLLIVCTTFLSLKFFNLDLEILSTNQLILGITLGLLPVIAVPQFIGNKLGGHSGDTYGATVVISETFILLLLALIW